MRPRPEQPAKHFWTTGTRQCVLYVIDGAFEVRLLDNANVVTRLVCRDGGEASATAKAWQRRPPQVRVQTPCARCGGTETRLSIRTGGFVYLRCNACRGVWRIKERRSSERLTAESGFSKHDPRMAR